jgi:hypothetical protein
MRKRLLLVIKDQLEFRLLVNDVFLPGLLTRFDVALMSPANGSDLFRSRVRERYPQVGFVDGNRDGEVRLIDRFVYWLKNELFFILNARRSETCFQKVLLSLELPVRAVARRILEEPFARTLSPIFNSPAASRLIRSILGVASILLQPIGPAILRHRRFYSPVPTRDPFDYILFGRPNAFANIAIRQAYATPSTRIITLCRNLDVPAAKGIFTVPSDYTIVFDVALYEHLRTLNSPLNYGRVVLCDHPATLLKKRGGAGGVRRRDVLYAANARVFVPNEDDIVDRLYAFLTRQYGAAFRLFLRPHPTDYRDDGHCDRFAKLLRNGHARLEERYGQLLDGETGRRLFFPCPADTDKYYARLQEMDLILSSFSTINYEAKVLGVSTAFLKLDAGLDWVARRDHVRLMSERHGIEILTCLDGITKYLP